MSARVYSASEVERKRYQRACRKAAYKGEGVDRNSHFDRLQSQFVASGRSLDTPRDDDQFASLLSMLEGHPGRQSTDFLRECQKVQRANVGFLMFAGDAIAANVLKYTTDLLHFAQSLLAAENHLGSRSGACLRNDGAKLR
jgi:hypothetical protein